jgi:hypothetical protein
MTPQEEKNLLLRVVIRLAGTQLESGGLTPFGATLGSERDVKLLVPKGFKKNPTRDEVEAYWAGELRKANATGKCKTVCSCADVRVPVEGGNLIPGVLIHIEHAEGSAEDVLYPYRNDEGSVVFGVPTSVKAELQVFPPLQGSS